MKDIYLVSYSVSGIKTIDQLVTLSFFKKTITANPDTQDYNVKGLYGINGSGKSGIIASVDILKNLLVNPGYLNNPLSQKHLEAMINKKTGKLFIRAEYIARQCEELQFFRYEVTLTQETSGKYVISVEELTSRKATSKRDSMETIFKVSDGELVAFKKNEETSLLNDIQKKTINLLATASMSALIYSDRLISYFCFFNSLEKKIGNPFFSLIQLGRLGRKLYVYLDASDEHKEYFMNEPERKNPSSNTLMKQFSETNNSQFHMINVAENSVSKIWYDNFEKTVRKLYDFLRIFKSDLKGIEIDRKEDHDNYVCSLIMVYDSYKIHAEFESTGIKKLIRLFAYLKEMVGGGIVFIDEFDSNLHDVYLCALLEYLMDYGEGQLCFTTHNVGPMDVLRHHKKSIDFLSEDHKIYPWTTNGNYSPSKLYRSGMIEGSPFNVDSIDFISVFSPEQEED